VTIRKAIFWTHLTAGVVAALVVAMMSITGVLLTYERQMKDWADRSTFEIDSTAASRLSVDALIQNAQSQSPDLQINSITITNRDDMPPYVSRGRGGRTYLDPVTAEALGLGSTSLHEFFGVITRWHRWFDMSGDARSTGKSLTGVSNLLFLFLILSGSYLWLPPLYRWLVVKPRMLFNEKVRTSKARDYNWHHVFGFWSLIPLFLIVLSGASISYSWVGASIYAIAGEERPARGGGRGRGGGGGNAAELRDGETALPLQAHLDLAASLASDWQQVVLSVPRRNAATINVVVDTGTGGEPTKKRTLTVDRVSGNITHEETFADRSPAGKVVGYFRFLHTGETFGLLGQTIAGVVSALSVLMVWTGLALAYRRLIQPAIRRRRLS